MSFNQKDLDRMMKEQRDKLSKQIKEESKSREKASKSIKDLSEASKEASKLFSAMSKASEESSKAVGGFTKKVDDAASSFQEWIETQVKKLPLGEQAVDDPVKFSFKKDIPLLGSYVRLLENLGGAIEGAISSVVKVFGEDLVGLWGDAIDVVFENVKRKINQNLRESREVISGLKGIPDDLTNELGPLSKYVNKDFALGYYNFKKDYIIKPTAAGRKNVGNLLADEIEKDTLELTKNATGDYLKWLAGGSLEYLKLSLFPAGYASGYMLSNQLKGRT